MHRRASRCCRAARYWARISRASSQRDMHESESAPLGETLCACFSFAGVGLVKVSTTQSTHSRVSPCALALRAAQTRCFKPAAGAQVRTISSSSLRAVTRSGLTRRVSLSTSQPSPRAFRASRAGVSSAPSTRLAYLPTPLSDRLHSFIGPSLIQTRASLADRYSRRRPPTSGSSTHLVYWAECCCVVRLAQSRAFASP